MAHSHTWCFDFCGHVIQRLGKLSAGSDLFMAIIVQRLV